MALDFPSHHPPTATVAAQAAVTGLLQGQGTLATCIVDDAGDRLIDVNDAWLTLYGYDRAEALARPASRLMASPDPGGAEGGHWQTRADGHRFAVETSSAPLHLAGGDPLQPEGRTLRILVVHDVTARLTATAALAASEHRYRALLEGLPDLLFRMDAGGRFLYCHAPDDRSLFVPPDDLLGRTVADVLPPDIAALTMAALTQSLATGELQRFDYDLFHRGQVHHWEARILPSGPQEATVICRDLTDMRRLQAGLIVSERMASLGLLAAGIGHELNNPLTYVSANLDLAVDALKPLARQQADPALAKVLAPLFDAKSGAGRMREIVRNLRLFSQPQPDTFQPVRLADVVETALDLTMIQIRAKARVEVQLTAVPPVMGHPSALTQILVNLLINAVQALPDGDPATQTITVGLAPGDDGQVVLSVTDSGSGIAADLLPRLFEPFVTTKAAGEGTGLGLFICHSLVTGMGGHIDVVSTPGRGSTFAVVLPAGSGGSGQARPQRPPDPAAARILVVDDTVEIGHVLARMLEHDHSVDVVHEGAAVLQALADGARYDVIFCDLMMPHITGMDLHARLQTEYPDQAGRMVFMTGGAFTEGARAFLAAVPHPRLDKPFVRDEVLAAIARLQNLPSRP
jgi:PAS domain S-box-containing protein